VAAKAALPVNSEPGSGSGTARRLRSHGAHPALRARARRQRRDTQRGLHGRVLHRIRRATVVSRRGEKLDPDPASDTTSTAGHGQERVREVSEKREHARRRPAPPPKNGSNSQVAPRDARLLGAREALLKPLLPWRL